MHRIWVYTKYKSPMDARFAWCMLYCTIQPYTKMSFTCALCRSHKTAWEQLFVSNKRVISFLRLEIGRWGSLGLIRHVYRLWWFCGASRCHKRFNIAIFLVCVSLRYRIDLAIFRECHIAACNILGNQNPCSIIKIVYSHMIHTSHRLVRQLVLQEWEERCVKERFGSSDKEGRFESNSILLKLHTCSSWFVVRIDKSNYYCKNGRDCVWKIS